VTDSNQIDRPMKTLFSLLLSSLFLVAATFAPPTEEITVEGKLVDTKCYGGGVAMDMAGVNYGNDHKVPGKDGEMKNVPNCGTACAMMGIPVGIVEGDKPGGKTYVIIAAANALKDHVAKKARVTGNTAFDGGIIATKVEGREDGEWVDVTPTAMM